MFQIQSSKRINHLLFENCIFGIWSLFVIWKLEIDILK